MLLYIEEFFFHWMRADKTFRLMRARNFGGKDWLCKVVVGGKNISLYINGKNQQ